MHIPISWLNFTNENWENKEIIYSPILPIYNRFIVLTHRFGKSIIWASVPALLPDTSESLHFQFSTLKEVFGQKRAIFILFSSLSSEMLTTEIAE